MATLGEYFETEARERLAELDRRLRRPGEPDAGELYRHVRALRGTAQIAREDRMHRAARVLEAALHAVSAGDLGWTDAIGAHARATVEDLQAILERQGGDDQLDARVDRIVHRWAGAGVPLPAHITGAFDEAGADAAAAREFREFAAREVAAIADALDVALQQLAESPMDREPLRTILKRQRALLGATRLDELPVVAEILRAVEDLSGVIARLDIAVKREWLDVFRVARDGLRSAVSPLQQEQDPPATHSLSRLRHIREELLERYSASVADAPQAASTSRGTLAFEFADDAPAAPAGPDSEPVLELDVEALAEPVPELDVEAGAGPILELDVEAGAGPILELEDDVVEAGPAASVGPAVPDNGASRDDDIVSIDDLAYTGDAALRRALQLRDAILDAQPLDPRAREAASEVFDLIRMALG